MPARFGNVYRVEIDEENVRYWSFPMMFRDSRDYGDPEVKVSNRWYVWEPNLPFRYIGPLTDIHRNAEIGIVVNPIDVLDRIRTGSYKFVFPSYE